VNPRDVRERRRRLYDEQCCRRERRYGSAWGGQGAGKEGLHIADVAREYTSKKEGALGRRQVSPAFGLQPQLIYEVWKERGFCDADPDLEWGKKYLELAASILRGESVRIDEPVTQPFNEEEMAAVTMWERRSCRDWQERGARQDDRTDPGL